MSLYACEPAGSTPVPPWRAEAWVLTTEPGGRLLEEAAAVAAPGPSDLDRWRKLASPARVAAALRLAACRAKAKAKFSRFESMWLDPVGLEQATSETVARYKAGRVTEPLAVDLCAGLGGDALALAERAEVLAVDLDEAMCRRLAWNASVYGLSHRLLPCRARAERFAIPAHAWVNIDPDRRHGRPARARSLRDYAPGLPFVRQLVRRAPGGAVKLGPASDFDLEFQDDDLEIEVISLRGECKEATVWFGAGVSCRRRATRLPECVTWSDRDAGSGSNIGVLARAVSEFVYDPDPSLIRAGLLNSFAAAHALERIGASVDYLTGDRLVASPFLSAYRVIEVFPLDIKRLRHHVRARGLGPLEVKVRGLQVTPEHVRARLRPPGGDSATLILCGGRERNQAILAAPVRRDG